MVTMKLVLVIAVFCVVPCAFQDVREKYDRWYDDFNNLDDGLLEKNINEQLKEENAPEIVLMKTLLDDIDDKVHMKEEEEEEQPVQDTPIKQDGDNVNTGDEEENLVGPESLIQEPQETASLPLAVINLMALLENQERFRMVHRIDPTMTTSIRTYTGTAWATATALRRATATARTTGTGTATSTASATVVGTGTARAAATATGRGTASSSATATVMGTGTASATATATATGTGIVTASVTATATVVGTAPVTRTLTTTGIGTARATVTATAPGRMTFIENLAIDDNETDIVAEEEVANAVDEGLGNEDKDNNFVYEGEARILDTREDLFDENIEENLPDPESLIPEPQETATLPLAGVNWTAFPKIQEKLRMVHFIDLRATVITQTGTAIATETSTPEATATAITTGTGTATTTATATNPATGTATAKADTTGTGSGTATSTATATVAGTTGTAIADATTKGMGTAKSTATVTVAGSGTARATATTTGRGTADATATATLAGTSGTASATATATATGTGTVTATATATATASGYPEVSRTITTTGIGTARATVTARAPGRMKLTESASDVIQNMRSFYSNRDPFAVRHKRMAISDNSVPEHSYIMNLWVVIGVGVLIAAVMLAVALWPNGCYKNYTRNSLKTQDFTKV